MLKRFFNCKRAQKIGQTTFEYAILITIIVAAIITMHTYMRRAVQGRLKDVEVDLNQEIER
jgi:Flp pilus assembly pilin Flp